MPRCDHIDQEISTHGRCLRCDTQVFTSKALWKPGIPEFCAEARRFGMLKDPEYREIEDR